MNLRDIYRTLTFVPKNRAARTCLLLALAPAAVTSVAYGQGLQVTYGSKGVQTISFNGTKLEDVGAFPSDAFHIWHIKTTDSSGNVLTNGGYGWGETNTGESWNSSTQTETYFFNWGSIATQFSQNGNNLDVTVTETNYGSSGIILDGAEVYPFFLHFPQDPVDFSGYSQYSITTIEPGVSIADFGSGVVTAVIPNESVPLYTGWKNQGTAVYSPEMTSTTPDFLATFLPHNDYPLQPGSSFSYTVSLRFTPEGTPAYADDAYSSFAATYPSQMNWTDKRILGTAFLASSPSGAINQPGGFPTNPRRYFNDPNVDITTPSGLQAFQDRMLAQAASEVVNAQNMNAQGVITWDIEGEEYPQNTSYVCSPDQIASVAPEMESTISDASSPWYGQKLDDGYFNTLTKAGLRAGVCLRPQVFTPGPNNTASQLILSTNAAIIANLEKKARYANSRWGVTVFYVDSTVDTNGGTLDPAIFQQIITDLPSFLFIPEESTTRYYAYSAPFYSFIDQTNLGTPSSAYKVYPHAFGANLVNDVSAATLATYTPQLTGSVEHGDILMGHADYWDANDPTLVAIYRAAGAGSPNPPPTSPSITWPTPAAITYGTPLSSVQLNATANVPGTFMYTPNAGTVPGAGTTSLTASFTPANTSAYTNATATVSLTVKQGTPVITWNPPAPITYGTPLSGAQLNATANVPGTFTYTSSLGTILPAGSATLGVTFTPADATDYTSATATVPLTINPASVTPAVTWPAPASITYGTPLSGAQLDATANVSGTFQYVPAAGTMLNAGDQNLTVIFTPSSGSYGPVTATRTLHVAQATPQITWPAPAPITYGTPLSGAQLNAVSNVPGVFTYLPSTGTVLNAGSDTLIASFTPSNTTDYTATTASVSLVVNAATTSSSPVAILSPSGSASVSGTVLVLGQVNVHLDSAGSYLVVDGVAFGTLRVTSAPYVYALDTTMLSNGSHTLQIWAHDINNDTFLSTPVAVTVKN